MELKDLKSAWNKVSSENERKGLLPEEEFSKMLEVRTEGITEKIGKNIRLGLGIILGWICLQLVGNYFLSPVLNTKLDEIVHSEKFLFWMSRMEVTSYILIIVAIIIFWIRYNKIEKTKIDSTNLRSKLKLLIRHLNSYKRMFYIILGVIIVLIVASFSTGFVEGFNYQINELDIDISSLSVLRWIVTIIGFIISLGVIITIYYILFNLFFKRLYGKYLKQLKTTLKELEEPTNLSST